MTSTRREPRDGLANSRFHTLQFGINRLRSYESPHCWAKSHCSRAIVQPQNNASLLKIEPTFKKVYSLEGH